MIEWQERKCCWMSQIQQSSFSCHDVFENIFMMRTNKIVILLLLACVLAVTCIHPLYPTEQFLQHLGTLALFAVMGYDIRKGWMSMASYCGIAVFTLLHIIGARYIYSYVPYNEWIMSLTGFDINGYLGATRNHYDRIVHFSFGLVMIPVFIQTAERMKIGSRYGAVVIAWLFIQTGSMIYELFEWLLTIVMTSEAAENYNGQQGDMWDAQKDMALALLGSTMTTAVYMVKASLRARKRTA